MVRPVIVTCPFEGANLVFAVIDEMLPREKPCFISSIGPHGGSYIRTGDGDRKMTTYEVDRLLEEQRQPEHDIAIVPEATLDDLNPTLLRALLERERERHPHVFADRSDEDMMLDLRILREPSTDEYAEDRQSCDDETRAHDTNRNDTATAPDTVAPTPSNRCRPRTARTPRSRDCWPWAGIRRSSSRGLPSPSPYTREPRATRCSGATRNSSRPTRSPGRSPQ